jgi:hypothetical protein
VRAPASTLGLLTVLLVSGCNEHGAPVFGFPSDEGGVTDTSGADGAPATDVRGGPADAGGADIPDAGERDRDAPGGDGDDRDVATTDDVPAATDATSSDAGRGDGPDGRASDGGDVGAGSCAAPTATCVVRGSDAEPSNELSVRPLDSLDCTASVASDDDVDIVAYHWEVAEAPRGSTAVPTPADSSAMRFFVDVSGRFLLTLRVVDERGCESRPAEVSIVARPDEDLHIELTWSTPGDPDETDTGFGVGTDLDLHLLHRNGCWEDPVWDCHFRNRSPNWGRPGNRDDDPSMDIDDTDGAGPENINLNGPENGVTYLVGAHYYDDRGFGPSTATIRIYLYGDLVFERSRLMPRQDFWWVAAAVSFPSASVTGVDEEYQGTPCRR